MTPFTYGFSKAVNDMCLREIEREEVVEVTDYAEEAFETPAGHESLLHRASPWLRSLIHPVAATQVRRRHA